MKRYTQFINEAKLKGNLGAPEDFLKGIETKAQRELGVRMDNPADERRVAMELMPLIGRSRELVFGGLNAAQVENRRNRLQELAKSVIMDQYGSFLDNVDLDIKLVPSVMDALPEITDQPAKRSEREQREELDKVKKKEDKKEDPKKDNKEEDQSSAKKKSFLDKMFGDKPRKEEKEDFLKSAEYKKRIDKAKLINNIIQGEAKNTKHILHSDQVKEGLRDIFGTKWEEVFKTFDKITKAADKLDWAADIDQKSQMMENMPQGMAGAVKVSWPEADKAVENEAQGESQNEEDDCPSCQDAEDILKNIENGEDLGDNEEQLGELLSNGNPKIFAVGIDFPMLLHETVKGIYQLIASAYLPKQGEDEEEVAKAKVVQMGVSSFEDESEDFRYGPYIAAELRDFINSCPGFDENPNMREYVFGRMVLLHEDEFLSLMKGIFEKTDKAKKSITDIIAEINDEIKKWNIGNIDEPKEFDLNGDGEDDGYGEDGSTPDGSAEEEDDIEKLIRQSKEEAPSEDSGVDYSKLSRADLDDELNDAIDRNDKVVLAAISKELSKRNESVMIHIYGDEIAKILKS